MTGDSFGQLLLRAADTFPDRRVGDTMEGRSRNLRQFTDETLLQTLALQDRGVGQGDLVAVMVHRPLDMLQTVFAVALADAVVVPLPVAPWGPSRTQLERFTHVLRNCGARHVCLDEATTLSAGCSGVNAIDIRSTMGTVRRADQVTPSRCSDDLSFVQYTSGSTSAPRGVALDHKTLVAGVAAIQGASAMTSDDILCHWLPLSHDMGMFTTVAAIAAGADVWLASPSEFVKRPERWFERFCALRATLCAAPNFAYEYLLDAIDDDEAGHYDLSAARVLLNAAEPVNPIVCEQFTRRFAAGGLSPAAVTPGYGLAEATLAVTLERPLAPARVDWVDRDALNKRGRAEPVARDAAARGVTSCGTAAPGVEVRVMRDGEVAPDRHVGDVQIRGQSVFSHYFGEQRPATDADGWFATGDLGYVVSGDLHLTGRRKEVLIVGGQNYYPQDVEDAVKAVQGIYRRHAVAVLSVDDVSQKLTVLVEPGVPRSDWPVLVAQVADRASETLGGASVDVVLVGRNKLPRTTSGKFRRTMISEQLSTGSLPHVMTVDRRDPSRVAGGEVSLL